MKNMIHKTYLLLIFIILISITIITYGCFNYLWTTNNNYYWIMWWYNLENQNTLDFSNSKFTNKLYIPKILTPITESWWIEKYSIKVQSWETEFFNWIKTRTLGYNWSFLGPTIRVKEWQKISFDIKNNLDQPTTVHWHWVHTPSEYDWGVFNPIKPWETFKPNFEIKQVAWTFWYHPHSMWNTATQAYSWLAWLFIIDDDKSEKLEIPKNYWVDDIPLVIQDKNFDNNWQLVYSNNMHSVINWMYGNTIMVNWSLTPYQEVTKWVIRFRLLNWSNARTYNFKLSNNQEFYEIATDWWFVEKPVKLNSIRLSPWERAEILIDFSNYKIGDNVVLQSNFDENLNIIEFRVTKEANKKYIIPKSLVSIDWLDPNSSIKERTFNLQTMERWMMWNLLTINWKNMYINRVDEKIKLWSTEIWTIKNIPGFWMNVWHSFHIHDMQFQILSRNWNPPDDSEKWWKDTVFLNVWDNVKIIIKFTDYTWKYMYHCHILEHEDNWMMWVFEIIK